jgi:hypothetical protein
MVYIKDHRGLYSSCDIIGVLEIGFGEAKHRDALGEYNRFRPNVNQRTGKQGVEQIHTEVSTNF